MATAEGSLPLQDALNGAADGVVLASPTSAAFEALSNIHIVHQITLFQPGIKFKEWDDGDLAVYLGYYSLLRLKHNLNNGATAAAAPQGTAQGDRKCPLVYCINSMYYAVRDGDLDLMKWIHKNALTSEGRLLVRPDSDINEEEEASGDSSDSEESVDGTPAAGSKPPHRTRFDLFSEAAHYGHLHILKWLGKRNPRSAHGKQGLFGAIKNGHFDVVRWCCKRLPPSPRVLQGSLWVAMSHGRLEILTWLSERYQVKLKDPLLVVGLWEALKAGHTATADWAVQYYGVQVTVNAAIAKGHLPLLRWLLKQGLYTPPEELPGPLLIAATAGHLEVLQWFLNKHLELKERWITRPLMRRVAEEGQLTVLKWLVNRQVLSFGEFADMDPFDERPEAKLHRNVALNGHHSMLLYLYENRPTLFHEPLSLEDFDQIVRNGDVNILTFFSLAVAGGIVCTSAALRHARRMDNLVLLTFLQSQLVTVVESGSTLSGDVDNGGASSSDDEGSIEFSDEGEGDDADADIASDDSWEDQDIDDSDEDTDSDGDTMYAIARRVKRVIENIPP